MKIIAEFCQNHLGDEDTLLQMISSASLSGATHGKIQAIYSEELTYRDKFEIPGALYRPLSAEMQRLSKLELSEKTEKEFIGACEDMNLTPMITIFTHRGAERAQKAGFRSIKIASYDCASLALISHCLEFATELVISTGATSWVDICKTVDYLHKSKSQSQKIFLLHARTLYPCPPSQARLLRMIALRKLGFATGLSDHSDPTSDNLLVSKLAIALGAEVLERHFTILPRNATKDGPVSVTPSQLEILSDFSQKSTEAQWMSLLGESVDWQSLLAFDSLEPTGQELLNRDYYRGRFASIKNGRNIFPWEHWG